MWLSILPVSSISLIALAVQQAAATGWIDAGSFTCPSNTNNKCNTQQQNGFDWSSLGFGSFSSYGGFDFSGFECSSSFGKRDVLSPRGFQEKCIKGSVGTNAGSNPQISCGASEAFSITEMQISVSFDTDLDFIYGMADGSVCKHTASCASAGSTIQNTQCGGAKSVTFKLPDSSKQTDCSIGIHSIGFDCAKAESTVPVQSTTVQSTTTLQSPPASQSPTTLVSAASLSTAVAPFSTSTLKVATIAAPYGNYSTTAAATFASNSVSLITSVVFVTTEITKIECATSITNCPARSTIVFTSTLSQFTTVCPVTATATITTTPLPTSVSTTSSPSSPSTTKLPTSTTTPSAFSPSATILSTSSLTTQTVSPSISTNVAPGFTSTTTTPLPAQTTQEVVTTVIVFETTTVCPVTQTIPSGNTQIIKTTLSVSTFFVTSVKTVCTKCIAPQSTATSTTVEVAPSVSTTTSVFTPSISSSPVSTPSVSSSAAATALSHSAPPPPGTTQEVVTTEIVFQTTTVCPVTATVTTGALAFTTTTQSISTFFITSVSTVCTKCVAPAPTTTPSVSTTAIPVSTTSLSVSTAVAPISSTSATPQPPPSVPCPDVLPKCLNTWIFQTGCANNAHASCYCPQANFTTNVIACVQAYGADVIEVQAALSYLVGICAPFVGQNPGIITGLPPSISVGPPPQTQTTPVSTAGASLPATTAIAPPITTQVAIPVTTIIISTTITVPCTNQNSPIPVTTTILPTGTQTVAQTLVQTVQPSVSVSSTVTTIITTVIVPQVQFTTILPTATTGGPSIGLAAGAPATNTVVSVTPAATTAVAAGATTLSTAPGVGTTAAATTTGLQTFLGAGSGLSVPNGMMIGLLAAVGGLATML